MTALTQSIIEEIKSATEPVQREVLDFLLFLKSRRGGCPGRASATRPVRMGEGLGHAGGGRGVARFVGGERG